MDIQLENLLFTEAVPTPKEALKKRRCSDWINPKRRSCACEL